MKRLLLGLFSALLIGLVIGGAQANAAPGRPPHGGSPGVGGQVASVSGTTIAVTTHDGTANIATTASTTFTVDGKTATLSDITVGLYVHAKGTKATDDTFTATSVTASTTAPTPPTGPRGNPGVGGKVASVSGATITVTTRDGTASILTTASTTFTLDGKAVALSDITVGLYVRAEGTKASDGTFTATSVKASTTAPTPPTGPRGNPGVGGQVASVSGTTITVTTRNGTASIATTASTMFTVDGKTATLSDITVGLYVRADGTKASDGTFRATSVKASTTAPHR